MLIAYVDESYDPDFYFIGAAVAEESQWEDVESRLASIRATTAALHGTDTGIEFHGNEMMGGQKNWCALRGKHRETAGIYRAVLRAAREAGVRYVFRGLDITRLHARYRYPRLPHSIVLAQVLERIDDYTAHVNDPNETIVVADQVGGQGKYAAEFAGYQEHGTGGYRPSRLSRISSPINFCSSAATDGLQVADLAIYLHYRQQRVVNQHPEARRTLRRLWQEVEPAIIEQGIWLP